MAQNQKKINRETLYEEIWTEPMTTVALRYNMSDVGLAKNCKKMNIPRPGLGYWARVQAGQKIVRIPLPPPKLHSPTELMVTLLNAEEQERKQSLTKKFAAEKFPVDDVIPDAVLSDPHPLIKKASETFCRKSCNTDERGILIPTQKTLAISVTRSSLERALLILDALIKALIKNGVSIHVGEKTIVTVDGEPIEIFLNERIKRSDHKETPEEIVAKEKYSKAVQSGRYISYPHTPRYDYQPTGLLTIKLDYYKTFNDTNHTNLEERLSEIISCLFTLAADIKARRIERERRDEITRQKEERRKKLVERIESEKEALGRLEKDAKSWERSQKISTYINEIERNAINSDGMTDDLRKWIEWARAKADWLNPMNNISDLLLDAPIPQKEYWWQ